MKSLILSLVVLLSLSAQEFAYSISNEEDDQFLFFVSDDESGEIEIEINGEYPIDFLAENKERMKKLMKEVVFDRGSYYELIRFPDQAEMKKIKEEMQKKREEIEKKMKDSKKDNDDNHGDKHYRIEKFRGKNKMMKPMMRKFVHDGARVLIEKKYVDKSFVMTGENLKADQLKEIKDSKLKDADKKSLLEHIENRNFEGEARRLSYTINIIRDHIDKGNVIK